MTGSGGGAGGLTGRSLNAALLRFDELVRTLREKCPWDREQTHASLRRHLLEEAYEALEALDARAGQDDNDASEESDRHLCEELGDLLYQVWFQAHLASERGAFDIADVANRIHDKLVSRHPHVFGDTGDKGAGTAAVDWDALKQQEKGRRSRMDGIPHVLPALLRADKVLDRAARAGLAQPPAAGDAHEESILGDPEINLAQFRSGPTERSLGDLLLAIVEMGRQHGIDPEAALRAKTSDAEDHFRAIESAGPREYGSNIDS